MKSHADELDRMRAMHSAEMEDERDRALHDKQTMKEEWDTEVRPDPPPP